MLYTVTNSGLAGTNGRPTQIGANGISALYGVQHVFTLANFTTETTPAYSDPENDPLSYVKILSLPSTGLLELNSVAILINDNISSGDISSGNVTYTPSASGLFKFTFDIADTGSSSLSGLDTGVISMNVADEVNQPPSSVGDGSIVADWATTIVFTRASFTTSTIPAYADPEGDAAGQLKVLSLPANGTLRHNGNIVTVNQVIPFTEIDAGYFIYLPNTTITILQQLEFNFSIADAGSGTFVE
tara:strand:- start:9737 stop:10468 length:732 start_codon:yes stop_codon:yes gene_type:complete